MRSLLLGVRGGLLFAIGRILAFGYGESELHERNSTLVMPWRMRWDRPSSCSREALIRPMVPMLAVQVPRFSFSSEVKLPTAIMKLSDSASSNILR